MAGLYIHIPFCRSKCAYCDFFSTSGAAPWNEYVKAVLAEWNLRKHEIDECFTTLYIGGGTPSLLPRNAMAELMQGLSAAGLDIGGMKEVTLEANPEDIDADSIRFYRSVGINRLSIGIQSFDDAELQRISRLHDAGSAIRALRILSASGMNYNADLIYGLPGQDESAWMRNLTRLLSFRPPHFSAYLLSYEPGTKLYARLQRGLVSEASEELAVAMYEALCAHASSCGYEHYEVSNFSLPGRKAVHNSSYWNYTPYLGLGVAAHSFDGKFRKANPLNINKYMREVMAGHVVYAVDDENDRNRFNDYIITSLRTSDGFSRSFAMNRFGKDLVRLFDGNISRLSAGMLVGDESSLRIPEKSWLTSDAVLREVIVD